MEQYKNDENLKDVSEMELNKLYDGPKHWDKRTKSENMYNQTGLKN